MTSLIVDIILLIKSKIPWNIGNNIYNMNKDKVWITRLSFILERNKVEEEGSIE